MNSAVRIAELKIDAFRGITSHVTLDFTAPITLVFAPNGTGKTTLCEAAEWLLTGQVERLRDGQHFDAAILRSKFAETGHDPIVSAELVLGNGRCSLQRTLQGAWFGETTSERRRIAPGNLLERLAPAAAAPDAHHATAISLRQHWLRGTRFLSAESLAALIDTDEDTLSRRTQVFADLLGIRHLLDAERNCKRYIDELTTLERSLAERVGGQELEAAELRRALQTSETTGDGAQRSAFAEIQAGESLLGLRRPQSLQSLDEVSGRLEAAAGEHGRQQYLLDRRTTAVDDVERSWSIRTELEARVVAFAAQEKAFAAALPQIEDAARKAAALVDELTRKRNAEDEHYRVLIEARDILQARLATLQQAVTAASSRLGPDTALSLASLRQALPEANWTQTARRKRQAQIRAAVASSPEIASELQRRDLLTAQYEALRPRLPTEESLAALRLNASTAATAAATARARLDATSEPLERLQAAGRDFLGHTHDGVSDCPLCGHDWKAADRLRKAISATLSTVPELTRLAQSAVSAATQTAQVAQTQYAAAVSLQSQGQRLSRDLAAATQAVEDRQQTLVQLGLTPGMGEPAIALVDLERRLIIATALADFLRERNARAASAFGPNLVIPPDSAALVDASKVLAKAVATEEQAIRARITKLKDDFEKHIASRDNLRAQYSVTQASLQECREKLGAATIERDKLRGLWAVAAGEIPWTADALPRIRAQLVQDTDRLTGVAAHLAAARAAWTAEVRRARLEELDAAIAPQRARRQFMQRRLQAAERAHKTFHQSYTDVSRQQVDDLSSVVNPLFARMHANRIFDQINLGQADDFLRWLADAGPTQLDPSNDFSQGQRQDLALALFLARARGLGGTFFLDEPVTHLDDLNRVGLLDVFRATVMESSNHLNLVVTTASRVLARHLVEKFANIGTIESQAGKARALRVIELNGNGRTGVDLKQVYP